MLKRFFILIGIVSLVCSPAHAERVFDTLWETVRTAQTHDLPEGLSGAWSEDIAMRGQSQVLFADLSPFSALQIMLRLESVNKVTPLTGYAEVKDKFKSFVNYYLQHRLEGEPFGSIGFWPVWTLEDGTIARLPAADPAMLELMGGSLPADSDDSSQMAIWLYKTDPAHPYIKAYLSMLEGILDKGRDSQSDREARWKKTNSGAFLTWVSGVPSEENNVDCVVNTNILTSLALIKKNVTLSPALQEAEQNTTALVFDALTGSRFPLCSYYYSRWSHFYLALGKLYEAGGGEFTRDQWRTIRSNFKTVLLSSWRHDKHETTLDWAELLLAAKMLGLMEDKALQVTITEIREYLGQKVHHENYYSLIEGNDVFRGQVQPGMMLLWYVKAQSAATLMEVLN